VIKDKRRAQNAALVNIMTFLVLLFVNYVEILPMLVERVETVVVLIAQPVGPLKMEVPNVPRAVRERMAKAVKVATRVNFVLAV